ncbi:MULTISPECIES: Bro-N domain-containing protein [unclassified Caballeronia]|uniref:BRO-N domain-containing protein n=1 Tax=unclassified Caballeronia TaxID=2646786 RepID=UPI00285BD459|nr:MULTISPECIES: Bro-N domain-containing protein [unclassified Caballeronia]MDR5777659.1 Bro-N domain-containing protein [Caballeronia sp. LZ002]MDR5853096.1 Bro-N domain-containing protein [Caballeronia sp. LZ003]
MRANVRARPEQTQSLSFQSYRFDVIDREGLRWLSLRQIGVALGYANPHKVQQVFERNAAEFTDSMTAVVTLPTAGGDQQVRIFSLRGAHLLGMLARTSKAAAFRRWVLDLLEREAQTAESPQARPLDSRWLMYFDHDGCQRMQPVASDAVVIAPHALAKLIGEPGVVSVRLLPEIIASAASRLQAIERVRQSDDCARHRRSAQQ